MLRDADPLEPPQQVDGTAGQTVEVRSPDGSAHVHLLLAGLAVAARIGLLDEGSPELHAADLQRIPRHPA